MSEHHWRRVRGLAHGTPDGGTVAIHGQAAFPGPLLRAPAGVGYGPLFLRPRRDSVTAIERLAFEPARADLLGGLFGALAGASLPALASTEADPDPDEAAPLTRRELVTMGAAMLGGAAALAEPAAASEHQPFPAAEFDLTTTEGVEVRVLDRVAEVLEGAEWSLSVDGEVLGAAPIDGSVFVPPGTTGTITVATSGRKALLSGLRSVFEPTATYHIKGFGDPDTLATGATITLTDDPYIVAAVRDAGADNTILTIGGQSIPYSAETTDHPRGYFRATPDAVRFTAGTNPPAGTLATLRVGVPPWDEISDDADRFTEKLIN